MKSDLNILILSTKVPWPAKDGGSLGTFVYSRSLAFVGNSVTVACLNTNKHYSDLNKFPSDVKSIANWEAVDINTDISILGALKNLLFETVPYHVTRFYSSNFEEKLEELFSNNEFDIVQLEIVYLSQYIPLIRKLSPHTKIVLRAPNLEYEIWQRNAQGEKNIFKKLYKNFTAKRNFDYEKKCAKNNIWDGLITVTKRDSNAYKKFNSQMKTHVAPFGIRLIENQNKTENINTSSFKTHKVGYLGAMDWLPNQEGVEWFLENVWNKILKEAPDAKFHLAGRKMPQKYFEYASDSVIVLGEVDDAFKFMKSCDVMVVPLKSGSGMRVKIIEAMSQSVALVASETALEGIDAKDGQDIFVTGDDDVELFAVRTVELLQNKELALEMGKSAKEFVKENFDEDEIAKRMTEFYLSL